MEATHVVNINAYYELFIIHTYTYHNYINFYYMKFVPVLCLEVKISITAKEPVMKGRKKITFANNYNVIDYNTF